MFFPLLSLMTHYTNRLKYLAILRCMLYFWDSLHPVYGYAWEMLPAFVVGGVTPVTFLLGCASSLSLREIPQPAGDWSHWPNSHDSPHKQLRRYFIQFSWNVSEINSPTAYIDDLNNVPFGQVFILPYFILPSLPLLILGITFQINYLLVTPCLRLYYRGTQNQTALFKIPSIIELTLQKATLINSPTLYFVENIQFFF